MLMVYTGARGTPYNVFSDLGAFFFDALRGGGLQLRPSI